MQTHSWRDPPAVKPVNSAPTLNQGHAHRYEKGCAPALVSYTQKTISFSLVPVLKHLVAFVESLGGPALNSDHHSGLPPANTVCTLMQTHQWPPQSVHTPAPCTCTHHFSNITCSHPRQISQKHTLRKTKTQKILTGNTYSNSTLRG